MISCFHPSITFYYLQAFHLLDSYSSLTLTLIMVNISAIRASNAHLKSSKEGSGLVAVFAGATSGIGMGTLKQFAKQTKSPTAYIAVRSKTAAAPLLQELQKSNPEGKFILQETEISLMKNVDKLCDEIKAKEKKIDILFVSPGYLAFEPRNGTFPFLQHGFAPTNQYQTLLKA